MRQSSTRIMIVDRSEVARSIIAHILQKEMQDAYIVTCGSAEEALSHLHREKFDLITTALLLPGLDGLDLCHEVRKSERQRLTPVIVVSSDADTRLLREGFSAGVTDYFNKSLGYRKLVAFIKDVTQRHSGMVGRVLYVEDSLSTAQTTQALLENHGLQVTHLTTAEEALQLVKNNLAQSNGEESGFDVIFVDFFLAGAMTGGDLLYAARAQLHLSKQELPVLVVTIPDNLNCQADIFHAGANDFVTKPVVEEVLIARLKSLLLIKHQYNVLQRYSKEIYHMATTDALTGLKNKEYLFSDGPDFVKKNPLLGVLMIDVDLLEEINQRRGYLIGDHILHNVGTFLEEYFSTKKNVLLTRFGGKCFLILLAGYDMERAQEEADNLRLKISQLQTDGAEVTATIGVTAADGLMETNLNALVAQAENALLKAKSRGFNQTAVYG